MKQLTAFIKKESTEQVRTGRLAIIMIIFALFGIMNPAIAKLTPAMMDLFSESLAETGISISEVEINALTSWTQFYKNIPIALIIFILMCSNTLTFEYQRGTLINMLTKGLERWKVIIAKTISLTIIWSAAYWLCYIITYTYNSYFWDNGIASHLIFPAFCIYIAGIWLISLIMLMSTVFRTNTSVLASAGGIFAGFYMVSLLPEAGKYLPVKLMSSSELLSSGTGISQYLCPMVITVILSAVGIIMSVVIFNRKAM